MAQKSKYLVAYRHTYYRNCYFSLQVMNTQTDVYLLLCMYACVSVYKGGERE